MPVLDALRTETPRPRIVREHRHAGRLAVTTVCAGAFLGQFDAGIVAFSLPALHRHFDASPAAVQWVSLSYLLTVMATAGTVSRLADTAGHKLIWMYGCVVLTTTSAVCGLAPSLGLLVTFRVVQAVGTAMVQTSGVALMRAAALRERPSAVIGAAHILGLTAGPAAGGLLIASTGWRSVFLVTVPAGCVCVAAARYLLPRTLRIRRVDRAVEPASETRVWAGATSLGAVAGQFALFAPLVLLPQLCMTAGIRPAVAGLITAALPAGFALAAPAHRLLRRTGNRVRGVVAATGCVAAAVGIAAGPSPGVVNAVLPAVFGVCLGVLVITHNVASLAPTAGGGPRAGGTLTAASRELGMALALTTVTLCLHLTGRPVRGLVLAVLSLPILVLTALVATKALPARTSREPAAHSTATGTPPDARFLLANERTFLAWNRTALALVAAGLAIAQLLHPFPGLPWGGHLLAVSLILLGTVIATISYRELGRNQRALYRAEPLPLSVLPKVLALAVTTITLVSAAVLLISAARGQ